MGAVVTLLMAVGLIIIGTSLAVNGCDCAGAPGPEWLSLAVLGVGVASGLVGLALMWRFIVRVRAEG